MPVFVMALLGGLINISATIAGRVMIALGFSIVTYTGISASLTFLRANVVSSIVALPPDVVGMLATMKVGEAISIVFSALLARLLLSGLSSDSLKRLVQR